MNKPSQIDDLAKKLAGFMPSSVQNLQEDIEHSWRLREWLT